MVNGYQPSAPVPEALEREEKRLAELWGELFGQAQPHGVSLSEALRAVAQGRIGSLSLRDPRLGHLLKEAYPDWADTMTKVYPVVVDHWKALNGQPPDEVVANLLQAFLFRRTMRELPALKGEEEEEPLEPYAYGAFVRYVQDTVAKAIERSEAAPEGARPTKEPEPDITIAGLVEEWRAFYGEAPTKAEQAGLREVLFALKSPDGTEYQRLTRLPLRVIGFLHGSGKVPLLEAGPLAKDEVQYHIERWIGESHGLDEPERERLLRMVPETVKGLLRDLRVNPKQYRMGLEPFVNLHMSRTMRATRDSKTVVSLAPEDLQGAVLEGWTKRVALNAAWRNNERLRRPNAADLSELGGLVLHRLTSIALGPSYVDAFSWTGTEGPLEARALTRENLALVLNEVLDGFARPILDKQGVEEGTVLSELDALMERRLGGQEGYDLLGRLASRMGVRPGTLLRNAIREQKETGGGVGPITPEEHVRLALDLGLSRLSPEDTEAFLIRGELVKRTEEKRVRAERVKAEEEEAAAAQRQQYLEAVRNEPDFDLLMRVSGEDEEQAKKYLESAVRALKGRAAPPTLVEAAIRGSLVGAEETYRRAVLEELSRRRTVTLEAERRKKSEAEELHLTELERQVGGEREAELFQAAAGRLGVAPRQLLRSSEQELAAAGLSRAPADILAHTLRKLRSEQGLPAGLQSRLEAGIPIGQTELEERQRLGRGGEEAGQLRRQFAERGEQLPQDVDVASRLPSLFESVLQSLKEAQKKAPASTVEDGRQLHELLPFELAQEARRRAESLASQQVVAERTALLATAPRPEAPTREPRRVRVVKR